MSSTQQESCDTPPRCTNSGPGDGGASPSPTPGPSNTGASDFLPTLTSNSTLTVTPSESATMSSTPPPSADHSATIITTTSTLAQPTPVSNISSSPDAGPIAGGVIGGVIFLVLIVLGLVLYLRARKKRRTPPSSEFMDSIRAGAAPVLRLDSGAEYTPALPEKGGGYADYPPPVPHPFMQNSYYPSPAMQTMKFPDEMMANVPSERPSIDKPLHPQRYSAQQQATDALLTRHHPGTSIGSRRELWGSDTEGALAQITRGQSPAQTDSMLQFAPRFSLDDPSLQPLHASYSPPSLHPLRRQPDQDGS